MTNMEGPVIFLDSLLTGFQLKIWSVIDLMAYIYLPIGLTPVAVILESRIIFFQN